MCNRNSHSCKSLNKNIKFGLIFPLVIIASVAVVRKEIRSSHRQPPTPVSTDRPPTLEPPTELLDLDPIGTDAAVVVVQTEEAPPEAKPETKPESNEDKITEQPTVAKESSAKAEVVGNAEVVNDSSISTIAEGAIQSSDDSQPVLGKDTPEWIKKGLVLGESLRTPLSSSLYLTLDECRKDLESRIFDEAKAKIASHTLHSSVSVEDIPQITREYVLENWVTKDREFDNVQIRPSGTYHQLWCELNVSQEELKKVRDWELPILSERRTKQVGALAGFAVVAMGFVSGLVGLLAGREKAKLKKQ